MPNYGEYARCDAQAAGEYWSGNAVAGKWAWAPNHDQPSTSSIQWGKPTVWPPLYRELFDRDVHNVDKMFLRGWYDNGTFYSVHVERALMGDEHGNDLVDIAIHPDGWQTYAFWDINPHPYCLDAYGYLVEELTGKQVHFWHRMVWYPPRMVANRFHPKRDCIVQWERWDDDQPALDGRLVRKVERTNYLARGAGMAWAIRQHYPAAWDADLRDWWLWPR